MPRRTAMVMAWVRSRAAEFLHDMPEVNFDGFFRYEQQVCDIAIAISRGHMPEYLDFPAGESLIAEVFGEFSGYGCRNALFAGVDMPDDVDQFGRRHAFQNVPAGSGFERALHFDIAFERGEDDDARRGKFAANGEHRVDAVQVRQAEIHEHDIRVGGPVLPDGFGSGGRLRDQLHIGLAVDDGGDALPQKRMVVDAEDADTALVRSAILHESDATILSMMESVSRARGASLHVARRATAARSVFRGACCMAKWVVRRFAAIGLALFCISLRHLFVRLGAQEFRWAPGSRDGRGFVRPGRNGSVWRVRDGIGFVLQFRCDT